MLSLLLIPLLWIAIEDPRMLGPLRSMLRPLVFVGVVGMALTGLGMEYFLFRFDNSHPMKQVFWFCVLFFAPVGPALYCFLVYSRSDVVKRSSAESPHPLLG